MTRTEKQAVHGGHTCKRFTEKGAPMTKSVSRLVVILCCAAVLTGCSAWGHAPVIALVTLDMKGPVAMGPGAASTKVGRAEAWGILVFATGDASISAAMRNGNITRVHHVDHETTNILGVYARYITVVYGD
jgi:TRL-like protein family